MELYLASKLVEFITDSGCYSDEEVYVKYDYSGLGMYGDRTTGIVVPSLKVLIEYTIMFAPELSEIVDEDGIYEFEDIEPLHIASLGNSYIVY